MHTQTPHIKCLAEIRIYDQFLLTLQKYVADSAVTCFCSQQARGGTTAPNAPAHLD